jgi:adenylosuccinate lyase
MGEPLSFVGNAEAQVADFVGRVGELAARYPEAATYSGEEIL